LDWVTDLDQFTVVLDACVLYPAPLRSFLMYLALTGLYRPRWTAEIHEEWMRSVLKNFPDMTRQQVERIRDLMDAHVRNCLVSGYQTLIPTLELPDPDDRHVLAAAIHVEADAILTFNLRDFPSEVVFRYGIKVLHPDEFLSLQLDLAPEVLCAAGRTQRAALKNPPLSPEEFLRSLGKQGLPKTVAGLKRYVDLL
jgi:predicted nucleic acid-binding protein